MNARFDRFQVDLSSNQLFYSRIRVPIQEQPLQILRILLEAEGGVVTREQLRSVLWPKDTFVDFEHGVNTAVKKLRRALKDSAESPRFIETLPKVGYRFMIPVEWTSELSGNLPQPRLVPIAPPRPAVISSPALSSENALQKTVSRRRLAYFVIGLLLLAAMVGFLLRPVIAANPAIAVGLKIVVALYLAYMAVRLWRRTNDATMAKTAVSWRGVFVATLLNPKGLIFALVIVPFGSPDVFFYLLAFAAAVIAVGLLWLVTGNLLGAMAGEKRRLVPRIASVALVGFAGLIAASAFG